ncbi:clavaldehyde dehydrogenase [Escherichia coli]|nr:clavaldehyde dehydrogenase [Escherichia coli]
MLPSETMIWQPEFTDKTLSRKTGRFKGVLWGIGAVLPVMEAQGSGQIINLGSIGALSVVPTGAVYCASKLQYGLFLMAYGRKARKSV